MDTDLLVQILTIGGPVALIAVLSMWINYKLTMTWMNQVNRSYGEICRTMGEVLEGLRRLNGEHGKQE